VEGGADPLTKDKSGNTIYHEAVARQDPPLLSYALSLKRHYTVDIESIHGGTPASIASANGSMDCLNLLIEHGADIKSKKANCLMAMI
jgi:ankyrin repeat protein